MRRLDAGVGGLPLLTMSVRGRVKRCAAIDYAMHMDVLQLDISGENLHTQLPSSDLDH